MNRRLFKTNVSRLLKIWLDKKASTVNHRAVIRDIYQEVGISAGYFLMLTLANLIALSGLITNSTAVIIGAMLISPLMGPILSSGFAFITGDMRVGRRALRKITLSVAVTLAIAAFATYISPLKDVTSEILARTRPNLYDLSIAFLAGTAGAIALCTKRSIITIVPGVAIATAVIPPLSVAGYGLGTGQFMIALGGFFLFFTNFVAIVVCTSIIFYIYGFRPAMVTPEETGQVKKRVVMLAGLLFVISIPLVYTLVTSLSAIRLKSGIESILKQEYDREHHSRLVTAGYRKEGDGSLEVDAVVNTVEYLKEEELKKVEKRLSENLGRPVTLEVEQVRVRAGGLKEESAKPGILPAVAPPKPPEEISRSSVEGAVNVARKVSDKIGRIIAPSSVAGFHVGFAEDKKSVSVLMKIRRDQSLSDEQRRWLQEIVVSELGVPAEVTVETTPFVQPLVFKKRETSLTDEMKGELAVLKEVNQKSAKVIFTLESCPESDRSVARKQAGERLNAAKVFLVENLGIPEDRVTTALRKGETMPTARVTVTVSGQEIKP